MATDPTGNEADGTSEDARDESVVTRTPGPPRPPRPGKRSKESGRISIPLPQSRRELEPVDAGVHADDPMDAAPGVDIAAAERDEPAFPLMAARAKPPSVPAESFADRDADFADFPDHAPNAPVTPLHGLSTRDADPGEVTPPRGTPMHFVREEPRGASKSFRHEGPFRMGQMRFGRDDESDSEPEPTIVGRVPENLLELSGAREENTQAFTAPRELIELAKRSREDRAGAKSGSAAERETPRPPRLANSSALDLSLPAAPHLPHEYLLPAESESEAAPPVKRTVSGEMEAAALPSRRAFESAPAAPSSPEIDIDPPSELSPSPPPAAPLASRSVSAIDSELPSALRRPASGRGWLMTVGLFVIAGIVIARWRELAALFH